jgi:hypothetical protein
MRTRPVPPLAALALSLAACVGSTPPAADDDIPDDEDPAVCEQARTYTGLGGTPLEAERQAIVARADRMRLKPFAALSAEYSRALGLASFDTSAFAATFGRPPARWFTEPAAGASTVYGAFALAFAACQQHTATGAAYAAPPTRASADVICRELARRAWHRDATDAEAAACVTYAVDQTDPADAPRRRWAHPCAAVLSASGFLAY